MQRDPRELLGILSKTVSGDFFYAVSTIYHCLVTFYLQQSFDHEGIENTPDFRNDTINPIVELIMQIYRHFFASASFRDSVYETESMDIIGGIFGNETPMSSFVLHSRGK